ncbi:MAG: glycosyltransferase, partial [Verrucomicrobia bacterium]|nr:glycosyltransferase [Verrucomicrobiota bacterium]
MMKIVILTPAFKRVGSVLGAFIFAKYLHEQDHDVVITALDADEHGPSSLLDEVLGAGVPFYNFEMTGWTGLRRIGRVRSYVKDNGIDAVVSYGLRPDIVNSCLSRVGRLSAIREILRDQYALSYGWLLSRLGAELHLRALKKLDGIFVLNRDMATHLAENGINPSLIHLVNNFVDVAEIRKNARDGDRRPNDYVHVGYFGRLIRRKRVDIALHAVHKLVYRHAHRNIKFHVAGDGPLHHKLSRLTKELGLSEQTIFHGHLSNPLDLMKKMDLIVLTSDREGTPRCLLEAMSLGKTCIASDIPGMSELIR